MKKLLMIFGFILAPLFPAHAQYTGPSTQAEVTTVKQLQESGFDNQRVVLRGHLLSEQGEKRYRFADESGEMMVKIDRKAWPRGVKIDDKTRVELRGKYDKGLRDSKVEVNSIRLAQ